MAMFNGKINYKWQFSIAMLNYQRVIIYVYIIYIYISLYVCVRVVAKIGHDVRSGACCAEVFQFQVGQLWSPCWWIGSKTSLILAKGSPKMSVSYGFVSNVSINSVVVDLIFHIWYGHFQGHFQLLKTWLTWLSHILMSLELVGPGDQEAEGLRPASKAVRASGKLRASRFFSKSPARWIYTGWAPSR